MVATSSFPHDFRPGVIDRPQLKPLRLKTPALIPANMRYPRRILILASLLIVSAYFISSRSKPRGVALVSTSSSKPASAVVGDNQPPHVTLPPPHVTLPPPHVTLPPPDVTPPADPSDSQLRVLAADPQASQVVKDANGNAIEERVMTPDGPVTIQRTFTTTGELVRERALLNGKAVPVPSLIRR
jgi:hypothetical protein